MDYDAYNWIATRELVDKQGMHHGILRLSAPRRRSDIWECAAVYTPQNGPAPDPIIAHGVDSLQALHVAIEGVRLYFKRSQPNLWWLGFEKGAGLPAVIPMGLGADFHDRMERLVEDEVAAHVAGLKAKKAG